MVELNEEYLIVIMRIKKHLFDFFSADLTYRHFFTTDQ
jgi:hypothetical protein